MSLSHRYIVLTKNQSESLQELTLDRRVVTAGQTEISSDPTRKPPSSDTQGSSSKITGKDTDVAAQGDIKKSDGKLLTP